MATTWHDRALIHAVLPKQIERFAVREPWAVGSIHRSWKEFIQRITYSHDIAKEYFPPGHCTLASGSEVRLGPAKSTDSHVAKLSSICTLATFA